MNEMVAIRENGAASGPGLLAQFGYDDLGRRTSLTRGNGVATSYGYDGASDLTGLAHDLPGVIKDLALTFGYSPAGQIAGRTASNELYSWTGAVNGTTGYTADGLNKYTDVAGLVPSYDSKRFLTNAGGPGWSFGILGQLATVTNVGTLHRYEYDALGRLIYNTGDPERLVHEGSDVVAEYNATGGILRRYVYGPGVDEPLLWYEGGGLTDRRWLAADERGSIIAVTDGSGNATAINRYDEYGVPQAGNVGRFQYTGQQWHTDAQAYDYKARIYSPYLGRFLQTDPVGYAAGMNIYNYVGGDPVNGTDPSGLAVILTPPPPPPLDQGSVTVTGQPQTPFGSWYGNGNTVTGPSDGQIYSNRYGSNIYYGPHQGDLRGTLAPQSGQATFQLASGLKNPAALFRPGPNFAAHMAARHLFDVPGTQSKFSRKFSDPFQLLHLMAYAAVNGQIPTTNSRFFSFTVTNFPEVVGTEYGVPTHEYILWKSIILGSLNMGCPFIELTTCTQDGRDWYAILSGKN